ncbi:MAG: hypothetical protein RMX68_027095 [Aulosira sp. ZfuVER01]|nr:hypothetical protein [Aulosira sp. ZfuVER01]MDZ7996694.1 hypothetical protein [Aulosira sp. DedVER01a]MDZ8053744.1 hypothetical protein [Aulosira sp. ZfuCHP01]
MKLYLANVSSNLPDWATVTSKNSDLIEVAIKDHHPEFQLLLANLATEIQPGVIGVKAADLCSALVSQMTLPKLSALAEIA